MTCIAVFRFTFLTWSNFYQTTYILIKQSRNIDLRRCIIASRACVPVILARATGANPSLRPPPLFLSARHAPRVGKPRPPGWRRRGSYPRRALSARWRERRRRGEACGNESSAATAGSSTLAAGSAAPPPDLGRGDTGAASEARRRDGDGAAGVAAAEARIGRHGAATTAGSRGGTASVAKARGAGDGARAPWRHWRWRRAASETRRPWRRGGCRAIGQAAPW